MMQRVSETFAQPGGQFTIEPANWRDLNGLRNLEQVCFPLDAWPLWDLIGVLTLPNVVRLKAVNDEHMVGFIAADLRPSEQMAWIAMIGVLPAHRGRGIGAALLEDCEGRLDLPRVRLNVRISNHTAIRLYQHSGYYEVGIWPRYYHNGEDALIFEKQL